MLADRLTNTRISSNRYSMPVTGLAAQFRSKYPSIGTTAALGHANKSFYIGDEDETNVNSADQTDLTPDVKSILQLTAIDDKFPTLVRRDDNSGLASILRSLSAFAEADHS